MTPSKMVAARVKAMGVESAKAGNATAAKAAYVTAAKATYVAATKATYVTATKAATMSTAAAKAATTMSTATATASGLGARRKQTPGQHRACQYRDHSSFHDFLRFDGWIFRPQVIVRPWRVSAE
jgi:hypothetical protein